MKRAVVLALIFMVIATVFYFTRPSDTYLQEEAFTHISTHLSKPAMPLGMDILVKQKIEVKDNFLYKTITYDQAGTKKAIGYGFIGMYQGKNLEEVLR